MALLVTLPVTLPVAQGVRVGEPGASAVALSAAAVTRVNVEGGCALPDPCDSGPCPPHSYCSDDWDSFSCRCHPGERWGHPADPPAAFPGDTRSPQCPQPSPSSSPGYFGDSCVSACALNPCQSPATCARKPGSAHGYSCECPQGHFGPYCEHK